MHAPSRMRKDVVEDPWSWNTRGVEGNTFFDAASELHSQLRSLHQVVASL